MRGLVSPLIKLLVFLVITAFATYVLGATIANSSYGSTHTYHADFTDVTGLNLNDDVRIAGVRVGSVTGMQLERPGKGHATSYTKVTFTVSSSRSLPTSAEARLRYRNLVGQRYLDIEQGAGAASVLEPGGTITHTENAVDLTVLFNGFNNLATALAPDQINKLSYALIQTLQGESGSLNTLLSTVASLTNTLADKDKVIGDVIDNLTDVLSTVAQRDTELTNLIVNLRTLVSGLAGDRTTIGNAIDGINGLATSTAGLLKQVRSPLKQDIASITGLVDSLNENSGIVQYVIQQLPATIGPLIRTASYGSWFNFYLCQATVAVQASTKSSPVTIPTLEFGDHAVNQVRGCAS